MKFLGESEWKRKKHGPEYRRQWRKLHIAIDAKTLQIRTVQLTTNNVMWCIHTLHFNILSLKNNLLHST